MKAEDKILGKLKEMEANDGKLFGKLEEMETNVDKIAGRVQAMETNEGKIFGKLDELGSKLKEIEANGDKMISRIIDIEASMATKTDVHELRDEMVTGFDQVMKKITVLDDERVAMISRIARVEGDVSSLKSARL